MKKYDVITSGSGLVDAFIYTGVKENKKEICFPSGTKIKVENVMFSVGGGGINTAKTFAKLGLKTGFLGKVGEGYNSQIILRELKKNSVDFLGVKTKKEHAGYSFVLETNKKHRTILTYKAASDNLKFREINLNKLKTKWFHLTPTSGETFKTQLKLIDYARENKIKVSFNPSSYQVQGGLNQIRHLIKGSFIITMNKEEAEELVGNKNHTYKKLHELGPEIVVITNGENPGIVYDGKNLYNFYPNKINATECTGAGDVFASTFVATYSKTNDIIKSIKVAMANSESVVVSKGANMGVLSWNEIENKLKKKTFRVVKVKE